ncbi:hypothetical protein N0V90_002182 [Kalmusia sp. IMI 367209]|nr:hypothetical protein N0V90_002182 [Kalmusia sp. IMI 367209]
MPGLEYLPRFLYYQWFLTPKAPTRSFAGQTVIITGSNQGLGFEAAKHIVRLGAEKVVLAVRSVDKGNAAQAEIERVTGRSGVVEVWSLDLQSYESVKEFAAKAQGLNRLDVVLENAGISTMKYELVEGHESTITTNVISTFLLALLLLPKLKESARRFNIQPHLTIVSSEVHYFSNLPQRNVSSGTIFNALTKEETFKRGERYWTSKLILVLAFRQMIQEEARQGYPVIINQINPGMCYSGLTREIGWEQKIIDFLFHARSTEVGSRTLVDAASFGPESHGEYLSNCRISSVSSFITSEEGQKTAMRVWTELKDILENIQPGILKMF